MKSNVENKSSVVVIPRVVIIGAAESGVGAAVLAVKKGFDVFVSDNGNIKEDYKRLLLHHSIAFEEGVHTEKNILNAKELASHDNIKQEFEKLKSLIAERPENTLISEYLNNVFDKNIFIQLLNHIITQL